MYIHVLWALIIAFAAVMYTIFDGFDLGVGILMLFVRNENDRDKIVDSITPVWDGNETWIVLMGVGMFGGFPYAYSVLLPTLYLPVIVMIISLALRGVSMEYRFITRSRKKWWDGAFTGGSIMAAFCQGLILGNLMEGIVTDLPNRTMVPSFHFLTPFSILTGLALIVTYSLIGANWLNFKISGQLQKTFKSIAAYLIVVIGLLFLLIIYGRFNLPVFSPRYGILGIGKILSPPAVIWYIISAFLLLGMIRALRKNIDWLPFALNIAFMVVSGVYLVAGFWPYIVPPEVSLYDAGSPLFGNSVLLYSALVIIPIILAYLAYSYVIFRGKVTGKDHYDPEEQPEIFAINPSKKINGNFVDVPAIHLTWAVKIAIATAGLFFFFVVLGFFGNATALLAIAIFVTLFLIAWWSKSK